MRAAPLRQLVLLIAVSCAAWADAALFAPASLAARAGLAASALSGDAARCPAGQPAVFRAACSAAASRRASAAPVAMAASVNPMSPGSLVALVTPMHPDGELDLDALRKLLRWHVASGTNGVVALGTTGEASVLSMDERAAVLRVCQQELAGKLPLMVGTGTIDPKHVIAMNEQALEFGADACLVVTPYYVKPTQQGMIEFFRAVADATPLPMLLYNVPGRTAADLKPETVAVLARHERIFGIKEATGDLDRVKALRDLCGPDFMLLSGEDSNAFEFTLLGGDGVISVTSNVAPELQARIFAAALAGDAAAARSLNAPLERLHQRLFLQANPIPAKWAVQRMGRCGSGIRLPLTPFDEAFHASLEEALREALCLEAAPAAAK